MQDVQGATIMFVGDRTMTREPYAVSLPKQKPWTVVKKKVNANAMEMREHYEDDENYGTLWSPVSVGENVEREIEVPAMLSCPKALVKNLRESMDSGARVKKLFETIGSGDVTATKWALDSIRRQSFASNEADSRT